MSVCRCRAAGGRGVVIAASHCTEFGQGPVDELHIIENMADRVLSWELTLFFPRVKSLSFFDRFRTVFPVGGESGAQAQLTAVRTAKKAGIAGQRSWFREAHATFCRDRIVSPYSGSHDGGAAQWGVRWRRLSRRQTQRCVSRESRSRSAD
jgi:hypothetical protein